MSADRKPEAPPRIPGLRFAFAIIGAVLLAAFVWHSPALRSSFRPVPYTDLVEAVNAGRIKEAQIDSREIRATFVTPQGDVKGLVSDRIPHMDERPLFEAMQAHSIAVTAQQDVEWWGAIFSFAPWLALILLFGVGSWFSSGMQNRAGAFGASKAKLYDRGIESPVTFADVAGVDEAKAELVEIVEFLKAPDRYREVGARVPKGVLLVGAPGTGKTLLARAVAGESGVPFFSIAGSEFVEMFVGVGASRVRDLFARAKEHTPCIVFIDELDAVGKSRSGTQGFVANEEREQTLNQLLIEMDGFDSGSGLIVVAATNRPEILDRALLRAGRFDRQVTVDRPDRRGREAILKVHTRKVALAPDVDLAVVAQRTPGMVGADLANVVNEAALASVRSGDKTINAAAFEEAIDRIQLGLKKAGRVMTDAERRRVAYHEAGHALVALSLDHVDPVHRVSIIPRSIGVLGSTLQLPVDDRMVVTERELLDRLCVLFGGRAAERIACEDVSTGAADDLDRATELARQMICRFGMSQALGPRTFDANDGARWPAGAGLELGPSPSSSEETRRQIDVELKRLLEEAQSRARRLLEASRPVLEAIARELLVHETLQRADLDRLLDRRRAAA